jgi:hypothetical protein
MKLTKNLGMAMIGSTDSTIHIGSRQSKKIILIGSSGSSKKTMTETVGKRKNVERLL